MFCTRCGHDMTEGTRFCPSCGSPAAPPQPLAAQPAPPPYAPPAAPPPPPQYAPPAYGQPPVGYGYNAAYTGAPQWAAPYPAVAYAGFWRRFLGYLIDGLVLGIAFVGLMLVFGMLGLSAGMASEEAAAATVLAMLPLFFAVTVLGGWLYFALQESSTRQATLGKMAIGVKVTDMEGNRLSFGRASGRYFAKLVTSLIPFGIGWMLAGWTAKKQAIHDMLASTLVVCR